MLIGGMFSEIKTSIMTRCLNRTSSQPPISTGSEPELLLPVGSWLHMVKGRYNMTA